MKRILSIDTALLEHTSALAAAAARLRKNHNFHSSLDYACSRLLNAVEPGSYVRPHRHLAPDKDETLIVLRGRFGVLEFDDAGNVCGSALLQAAGPQLGADIPHGTFHSLVALESGSVFFEAKAGPYAALTPEELASWAPGEGSAEAAAYLAWMRGLFAGSTTR